MMDMLRNNERKQSSMTRGNYADMELTREGWIFCGIAGLLETVIMLGVFRIHLIYVPVLVFLVLWAAFGIITSECLIGTGYINTAILSVVHHGSCHVTELKDVLDMKKAS